MATNLESMNFLLTEEEDAEATIVKGPSMQARINRAALIQRQLKTMEIDTLCTGFDMQLKDSQLYSQGKGLSLASEM